MNYEIGIDLKVAMLIILTLLSSCKIQRPDKEFSYTVISPTYPKHNGPAIYIDEAHHEEHTINTGYKPFADVLKSDGYNVFGFKENFSDSSLKKVDVLVIVNALNEKNIHPKTLPTYSAFTNDEIAAIKNWVSNGGALFLVADHMPYPGAASDLASQFGFTLTNSFAMRSKYNAKLTFTKESQTLEFYEPITSQLDSVVSFFGSAFHIPKDAHNLLSLPNDFKIYLTQKPWRFYIKTKIISAEGYSQGAVLEFGKGKVAAFGEGAMFTAQYMVFSKAGINSPKAKNNVRFLLNTMHWLTQ